MMRPENAKEEEREFLEEALMLSKYVEHVQEQDTDFDKIPRLEKVKVVLKCVFEEEG